MKNIFINSIVVAALLGWGIVIYQRYQFKELRNQVSTQVIDELNKRKKIEDSIKRAVESRNKDKEFIAQEEYRSQLESELSQRLLASEENLTQLNRALDSFINDRFSGLESQVKSTQDALAGCQSLLQEQAGRLEKQNKDAAFEDAALTGRLEKLELASLEWLNEQKHAVAALEEKYRQDRSAIDKKLAGFIERIAVLESKIEGIRSAQEEQEKGFFSRFRALEEKIDALSRALAAPVLKQ